jgi:Flp pilus assembly protein TadD
VIIAASVMLGAGIGSGCQSARGPYSPMTEATRDTDKAQRLTQEATALMDRNPGKAEKLLREALTADLYHGPAHNNLGVIYLGRGELFSAAGEFEWARKLLPGLPDPRINLAMVFEKAGRTDDALGAYASALEVYPQHLQATQGLVRLQIRTGRTDDRTLAMLDDVALRGEDERWRGWAREQRIRLQSARTP